MGGPVVLEAAPHIDRNSALRPIAGRLLNAITQHSSPDGRVKIGVKEFTLTITPWERGVLLETRERGLADTVYWGSRLLEALAAQAKGYADLSRLRNEPLSDEQRERCRQDLVADLALGRAIEAELAAVIAALEAADRRGAARNMTPSRQRLAETMCVIAEDLTESERQMADSLAASLFVEVTDETGCTGMIPPAPGTPRSTDTDDPHGLAGDSAASSSPASAAAPAGPAAASTRRRSAGDASHGEQGGLTRRHLLLAGAITFAVAAALTLVLPALLASRYEPQQAFKYLPGVRGYTGAPPKGTVTVSATEWTSLDPPGRTRLVLGIGAAMKKEGFTAVRIQTPDQKPVAEWAIDQGSRLY
jgi:hypothetical protein